MIDAANYDDESEPNAPAERRTVKRGAFPSPREDIDAATPYVPDDDASTDSSETDPTNEN